MLFFKFSILPLLTFRYTCLLFFLMFLCLQPNLSWLPRVNVRARQHPTSISPSLSLYYCFHEFFSIYAINLRIHFYIFVKKLSFKEILKLEKNVSYSSYACIFRAFHFHVWFPISIWYYFPSTKKSLLNISLSILLLLFA